MTAVPRVGRKPVGAIAFTTSEVNKVATVIDTSGVIAMLEPRLPSGGRPRGLSLRTLCIGLWLLTASGQPTYLNRVADLLNTLPPSSRKTLGLSKSITTRQVNVLFGHMTRAMDGSAAYSGRDLDDDAQADRDERLQMFVDLLVATTLPDDDEYDASGDLAFDATIIDANSRPEATLRRKAIRTAMDKARASGDPTSLEDMLLTDKALAAALGVPAWGEDPEGHAVAVAKAKRTARRPADLDATTLVYKGRLRHSYAVHLAVDIPTRDDVAARLRREADEAAAEMEGREPKAPVPDPTPMVIRRLVVTPSTASPGKTGAALLTSMAASPPGTRNGWKAADVVADRGYSNAVPTDWHFPLRTAGFNLIHDLHQVRRGHTGSHDGAVIVDGQAYSPGILEYPDLVRLRMPSLGAPFRLWDAYFAAIELRRSFQLPVKEISTFGASVRVECPALRGKLGCPIRATVPLVISKGVPEVFTGPSAPLPALCTKRSIRIPGDVLAQSQDLGILFGSRDWYDAFVRRRPRVEGHNGIVKNPAGPHLAAMRIRVRGRAKVSVFVALVACAHNVANVEAWREQIKITRALDKAAALARLSRKPALGAPVPTGVRGRRKPARAPAA